MAFFKSKSLGNCNICGVIVYTYNGIEFHDKGICCNGCLKKAYLSIDTDPETTTIKEVKARIADTKSFEEYFSKFTTSKKLGTHINLDETNKLWSIPYNPFATPRIYPYSSIREVEFIEEYDDPTEKRPEKSICYNLEIKISVESVDNFIYSYYIPFMKSSMKTSGTKFRLIYENALEVYNFMRKIYYEGTL